MSAALNTEAAPRRPRIAVVDMAVADDSPAGSCVLAEVRGLARTFDVTVFSDRFDATGLPEVEFVRVRAPHRPVLLRYLVFHLALPLHLALWRLRGGRADCVQATQGQWPGARICYAHFSHRGYLARQWTLSQVTGPRRWARWSVHRFNAACEAMAMRRARWIVVPSQGLARELASDYPGIADRIRVIANPVAIERFERPPAFDRAAARAAHGFDDGQVVLAFMALGDFERKGLGLLLAALAALPETDRRGLGLMVVGGQPGEIDGFARLAATLGVAASVRFAGLQADVRPFLWLGDAFAFPSSYETFGLAAAQAAAAGLPVMACEGVHGLEDFVVDGINGWRIARSHHAVVAWLRRVLDERVALARMGQEAADAVRPYATAAFQARWRDLFRTVLGADAARAATELA
jgi:glycosyltransferase involved in cell wall biosynthesis